MLDPDKHFDWTTSENGNPTCQWNFLNATVFVQDNRFKFVVNVDGAPRDAAIFSKPFRSVDQAIVMAEQKMEELFDEAMSRRA